MCKELCGSSEATNYRKRYFNNHGSWPRTSNQQRQDVIDERAARQREIEVMNAPTEPAHPVVSQQLSDAPKVEETPVNHVSKVVEAWHKANPGFR